MSEEHKTDNIYFPLCCLNYHKDITVTADKLISYGIIEYAAILEKEIDLNESDFNKIEDYTSEKNISISDENETDNFIILSAIKLGVIIGNFSNTKKTHREIQTYVKSFELKYGTDAKVKVNKDLLFDVRDKKFDERMFRVYCAVVSVIGIKEFIRITMKRIGYRMLGFKSEEVYYKEKSKHKLLTSRQIKTVTDKLSEQNFFAVRTYRNRLTFYSTKYRGADFDNILTNSIAMNKAKKEIKKIDNERINTGVEDKLKQFKEKLLAGESIKEIKSKMELFKAG